MNCDYPFAAEPPCSPILSKTRMSFDQMVDAFGVADPIDFLHALLRPLPKQVAGVLVSDLLGKLCAGE